MTPQMAEAAVQEAISKLSELRVEKDSRIPIYVQVCEGLRTLLHTLPPETRLPSSRELCDQLAISRMTLRQAFDLLEREGLLEARRGKGTFVAHARVEKSLTEMRGFREEMLLRGKVPTTRLLAFRVTRPSLAAREFFGFGGNEKVYEIRRLRFADGVPLAIEDVELPLNLCPELDPVNLASESLYILAKKYGVSLACCVDEISALLPTKEQKVLLGIDHPVALLKMRRRSYASNGQPVELAITLYRGDMHTALVRATRVIGAAK